jgi:hypothetical protein
VAEARKELAHTRHEHNKAAVNVKVADLKAKLQPGQERRFESCARREP